MSNTFKAICTYATDELVCGQEYICEEAGQRFVKVEGCWGRYYRSRFKAVPPPAGPTPAPTTSASTNMNDEFKAVCEEAGAGGELVLGEEYTCRQSSELGLVHVNGLRGTYFRWRFGPALPSEATTSAPPPPEVAVAPAEGLAGTLATRGSRYGSFAVNGQIAQDIKAVMRRAPNWGALSGAQAEALDMFASKISRLLTGDPNYLDNWHDIQGYASLIEDTIKE